MDHMVVFGVQAGERRVCKGNAPLDAEMAEAAADALRALRTSHAQAYRQAKTRRAGLLQAAARLHTPRPTVRCIM